MPLIIQIMYLGLWDEFCVTEEINIYQRQNLCHLYLLQMKMWELFSQSSNQVQIQGIMLWHNQEII